MAEIVRSVAVVGGGVIGAACAEYLTREGIAVTVVDRASFGGACSAGNCGLICPSHVLPLAEPGAIGEALRLLARRGSPFLIRPRFDPALWAWLWRFARRCNRRDMLSSAAAIRPLISSSPDDYARLIDEIGLDCECERRGLLFVYERREAMDHYGATDHFLRERFGLGAEPFVGEALCVFEPSLKPGLAGGWWYGNDAHLRPDVLMRSWRRSLEARGVRVIEDASASGFIGEGGRARAVRTVAGEITADAFVLAAGSLAPTFARELGCRLPIQPGKGYSITTPRPSVCPRVPMIFAEYKVAVTPFGDGYRLGSTMEFAGYDDSIQKERLDLLRRAAERFLREPYGEPVEAEWFGWRPMTHDGLPIIDRSPALSNVWIAAGHNMLGLTMAPATGRLVADLISGKPPHVDPFPYRVTRF